MIEKLTKEQEARFPEFVQYGINLVMCTDRSDRQASEKALIEHYIACGLKEPKQIIWLDSPYAVWNSVRNSVSNSVRNSVWNSVRNSVSNSVSNSVRNSVSNSVRNSVRNSVSNSVWNSVRNSVWNSVSNSAGAYYDADMNAWLLAWDQYGLSLPNSAFTFMKVNENVFYYYPTEDIIYVSDRPTKIHINEAGLLHCENGKALEFSDGTGISSWNGQTIPDEWVTGKPPNAKQALLWENMDQRSAACEIIGWDKLEEVLGSITIDKDPNPMIGTLKEMDIPDSGKDRFIDVMCGTGRRFFLPCPREAQTAREAQSLIHGGIPSEILFNCVERT